MRRHLRDLEEEGLVEASAARKARGGQPTSGRSPADGDQFPDGGDQSPSDCCNRMAASLPPEMVKNLLRQQR